MNTVHLPDMIKVGFEGIHRSGKGTQMRMLADYLRLKMIDVICIRGEYYRKGLGTKTPFDPISVRWQENWSNDELNQEKSKRLHREIRILIDRIIPNKNEASGSNQAVLFDRTVLSRHFLDSRQRNDLPFEESAYIQTKTGKLVEKVIPDIIFAFHCERDVLLDRLQHEKLNDANRRYKYGIIEKYANQFNSYLTNKLPQELSQKTKIIDATQSPENIHEEIINSLDGYMFNTGELPQQQQISLIS